MRKQKESTFIDETTGWSKDEPAKIEVVQLDKKGAHAEEEGLAQKVAKKKLEETREALEAKKVED